MYCDIVIVALPGPPWVKFTTSSNSWSVPLIDVMLVNRIIGFNSGAVMEKNFWTTLAPSISAAS